MSKELEKQIEDLTKSVADLTAKLEKSATDLVAANVAIEDATAKGKMSDAEKDFFDGLKDDDAKKEFMALSPEDRAKKVKKSADADEEVTIAGQAVKKSVVGDASFAIFKAQAEELADLKKGQAESAVKLAKAKHEAEAETAYQFVPGDKVLKGKMLTLIDSADEDVSKAFLELFKAHNDLIEKSMTTIGSDGVATSTASDKEAVTKFEGLVSEIKKRDDSSIADAWAKAPIEHPTEFKAYQEAS